MMRHIAVRNAPGDGWGVYVVEQVTPSIPEWELSPTPKLTFQSPLQLATCFFSGRIPLAHWITLWMSWVLVGHTIMMPD